MDFSLVVWFLIGTVVGLAVLYLVIRLAVRHALVDVRKLDAAAARRQPAAPSHMDADGL